MAMTRRVGVFGGAFDPPHVAHVALAQAAVEQLQLDELRVIPTGQAWHKAHPLSPGEHRLAMARMAFGGLPKTVIDERELRRPGPTYTIDTLRELKAELPQAQLFLVMGEDQAVSLTRWREWEAIPALATICMAARPSGTQAIRPESQAVHSEPQAVRPEPVEGPWQGFDKLSPNGWQGQLRLLRLPPMPESATQVRDLVGAGEGIAHLVPPGVARYIDRHSLYQPA